MNKIQTIEEYILNFPVETQEILTNIKDLTKKLSTNLTECISYGVPTFKKDGKKFFHFGAFKNHISIFPGPEIIEIFSLKLKDYKISKGTIQFNLNEEIPYNLIKEIIEYKISKNI